MSDLLKMLCIAATFSAACIYSGSASPVARIEITTDSGDLFIGGEGDTCADAWEGVQIPADWHRMVCVLSVQ
jgi:hypothetical protein